MGLTKDETLEVAKKVAEAIGKVDKVKCTVNMKTLEEDSFDLDYDGDEFDGGTYMIIDDGSVINAAHNGLRVGHMDDSTKDFITFFKKHFGKLAKESVDEGLNKSDIAYQLAMDYTGNSKPKITKLNKKRIQIMYGYKINPQTVIDSIKKVEPDVKLKHVEWSDKMTGGGFHIFDILESAVNEKFWTLLHGPGNFVTSLATDHETSKDAKDAVKYQNIKIATKAAKEFKRKHGVDVMVHVMTDEDMKRFESVVNEARYDKKKIIKKIR
jgi:hypothetical protein